MTKLRRGSRPQAAARTIRAASVLLGLLPALLFAFACGPEIPDFPHPQSLAEAKTDAAARGVPILIDFYTPG